MAKVELFTDASHYFVPCRSDLTIDEEDRGKLDALNRRLQSAYSITLAWGNLVAAYRFELETGWEWDLDNYARRISRQCLRAMPDPPKPLLPT